MTTPLSPGNARVKEARKLSRRSVRTERRLFLADGPNAVAHALERPGCVREVFATTRAAAQHAELLARASRVTLVADRAMAGLSDSVTPVGLVAVCEFLDVPLEAVLDPRPRLVAVCVDVRDPGNAGTVIRTADAAGADAVVLAGQSVDPYNPKTVRATAGSLFHLPVVRAEGDPDVLVGALREAGLRVLATAADGDEGLFTADLSAPTAWLFGNEAHGLDPVLAGAADRRVSIPIHGRAESLNLATAAAVCLYASARAHHRSES